MNFGLIVIGDEILSGKRQDKHLPRITELLAARGLALSWPAAPVTTAACSRPYCRMPLPAATWSSAAAASVPCRTTTRANVPRRHWACRWCCTLGPAI